MKQKFQTSVFVHLTWVDVKASVTWFVFVVGSIIFLVVIFFVFLAVVDNLVLETSLYLDAFFAVAALGGN